MLAGEESFSLFSHGIFTSELQFSTSVCSESVIWQKKPSGPLSPREREGVHDLTLKAHDGEQGRTGVVQLQGSWVTGSCSVIESGMFC